MGRMGLRIANVVLFVVCSYLTASIVNDISAEVLTSPTSVSPATSGRAPRLRTPTWADRKPILDRNLFGAQLAGDAPPPADPEENLDETKLPLRLLGTLAAEDPDLSNAAIEDLSSKKHEVVHIGDRLEGHSEVQVAGIERRRVILQNGPRREELLLEEEKGGRSARAAPKRSSRRVARRNAPTNRLRDRLKELRDSDDGGRSASSLFSDARILPKYEDGEMVGIQLNSIKSGSFYEKFGFSDGDVITELNGIRIDNPSASAQILSELAEANEFSFEKLGPNGPEKISVPADEVARILGDL